MSKICSHMDYIICIRGNLNEIGDCNCKVMHVPEESVTTQHHVVCKMHLKMVRRKRVVDDVEVRW